MTTGDEQSKSDVYGKLAVTVFPLVVESVQSGMTMKEFERGLDGGLLCTGKRVVASWESRPISLFLSTSV
ncbi:MAG: hypothetical protein FJ267_06195 [Planctomycetes bacterium]|nr:hypothetical protein [Planctomycetota bacterium]